MSHSIDFDLEARASPQDAALKAAYNTTVELWTLYSFGVAVTLLRTYARGRAVGLRHMKADDYLIWVAIIFYTAQTALAYSVGNVSHGMANNGMTDAQRAGLPVADPEYRVRVIGSRIQVAGWTTYVLLIGSLKLSMLAFYVRLTEGLSRHYRVPVYVGFGLVIGSMIASILTIFTACRPLHKYWQINPSPGNICQPANSMAIVWVTFVANFITDPYLIFIPIPMLWNSSLKLLKKVGVTIVLSTGIFVLVCATLKSVFLIVNPESGAQIAEEWGTRETFVAVITTNLPMILKLFRSWLAVLFGSRFQSSQKTYKYPSEGFRSIGGRDYQRPDRRRVRSASSVTANLTSLESEERMVDGVQMDSFKEFPHVANENATSNGIVVSRQVEVTHETRRSADGNNEQPAQSVHEPW